MKSGIVVEGMADWLAALADLRTSVAGNILGKALRQALRPVRDKARSLAPVLQDQSRAPGLEKGLLKKSIGVKIAPNRGAYPSGKVVGMVSVERGHRRQAGVRTRGKNAGKPYYQDPSKLVHLLEFGTAHAGARPFLQPALDSCRQQIAETIRDVIAAEMQKIAASGKWKNKLKSGTPWSNRRAA